MHFKRVFIALLGMTLTAHAVAPLHGADRLRELVVFPDSQLTFGFGWAFEGDHWVLKENGNTAAEILDAREGVKQQPDDPRPMLRLGNLLDFDHQTNEARLFYGGAVQLSKARFQARPQDGLSMTEYGFALYGLGQFDEAERMLRKAVLVSSNEWRCWVGLGNFMGQRSQWIMYEERKRHEVTVSGQISNDSGSYRPSVNILQKLESYQHDAVECFAHAKMVAPKEPDVFFQAAGDEADASEVESYLRNWKNGQTISPTFINKNVWSCMVTNLQRAAELAPDDVEIVTAAAYAKLISGLPPNTAVDAMGVCLSGFFTNDLPLETRRFVDDIEYRLQNLSSHADAKQKAIILENLGYLQMLEHSSQTSETLRQAVAIDPGNDGAWDLLLGSFLANKPVWEDLVALCQERLKHKDCARNRLLLARAYEHLKKWDKANAQAQAALQWEPDNYMAHLELMALALKQSADASYLNIFTQQNEICQKMARESGDAFSLSAHWREMTLDIGIANGMIDRPEFQADAKEAVDTVLKYFPNDKDAKQIQEALN